MFRDRELVVKMNKTNKVKNETNAPDDAFEENLVMTQIVVKDVLKSVFLGICAYVLLDTFRQVVVTRAGNPTHHPNY